MYDLIVIGAGPGGYEAAAHAGWKGKKVAIVERRDIGGTCLNRGCIPAKTLLKASKLISECRRATAYGVRVSDARVDLPALQERKRRIVKTLCGGVETLLKRSQVEVITGHATLGARNTVTVDGQSYEARNILIATGSQPAVPPIPGLDSAGVLDSTSILELTEPPARLAIIGGGYIGLEFASFFAEIGTRVTVVEALPQVAAGCDGEVSKRLLQAVRKSGVEVKLSSPVTGVEPGSVHYTAENGEAGAVEADAIFNATGRQPVTGGLGLDKAGVDYDGRGIRTSDQGKTNIPGVWACGDVTGRRLLAHAATREGIVAVNNMFGEKDRIRYQAIPAVIYTHPEVASVGPTEEDLQDQGVKYRKSSVPMAISGRFLVEHEGGSGFVKALVGAEHGNLLAVHAVGDGSSEFIMAAALMIEAEMRVTDLEQIVFPHPTISEALKEAIVRAR